MADIQKPDMSKQWANTGDKTPPSDSLINNGWASGDIPTNSDFNYIDARQDQGLAYVLQKGITEWDASTEYQANKSFVQYNGKLYKSIQTGVNKQPDIQTTFWLEHVVSRQELASNGGAGLVGFKRSSTALQESVATALYNTTSVKSWGAKGDGTTDDTAAFQAAMSFCATNLCALYIPAGNYIISSPLLWPNYYQIFGDGYASNIVCNLSAGEFAFKDISNFRYAWAIRNLRFTVKSGASTDVGAMRLAKHLRGGVVENIWTYELEQPFNFDGQIYGNLRTKGIRSYRVATSTPSARTAFYAGGEANTLFSDDIEIVGSWSLGFHINGGRVGSLTNFNIAGSSGAQMVEGWRIENYGNFKVSTGWVEQLTVLNTAASGYIKNCNDTSVENFNCASGSLYIDGGSDNSVTGVNYGNANGGLKMLNDAVVNIDRSVLKFQADAVNFANGQAFQTDVARDTRAGLLRNPLLFTSLTNHVSRTNASLVTIADNATTFDSGFNSKELTTSTNFQGAEFTAPCVAGKLYTCVVRAMLIENATDLYLGQGANTTRNGAYLYNRGTGTLNQWRTFILTGTSSTSTISFRLLVNGVSGTAKFLVDSVQIYDGINHGDPQLSGKGTPIGSNAPSAGTWSVGDRVFNSTPAVGQPKSWACTVAGTPGTWVSEGNL